MFDKRLPSHLKHSDGTFCVDPDCSWQARSHVQDLELRDEDVDKEFHILPIPPITEEAWQFIQEVQEEAMKLSGSYDAYNQVAVPSAGTTGEHPDVCETIRPSGHRQNQTEFVAKERPVETLRETRRKQLGSNGFQGN